MSPSRRGASASAVAYATEWNRPAAEAVAVPSKVDLRHALGVHLDSHLHQPWPGLFLAQRLGLHPVKGNRRSRQGPFHRRMDLRGVGVLGDEHPQRGRLVGCVFHPSDPGDRADPILELPSVGSLLESPDSLDEPLGGAERFGGMLRRGFVEHDDVRATAAAPPRPGLVDLRTFLRVPVGQGVPGPAGQVEDGLSVEPPRLDHDPFVPVVRHVEVGERLGAELLAQPSQDAANGFVLVRVDRDGATGSRVGVGVVRKAAGPGQAPG
jgi:hypothetical protein